MPEKFALKKTLDHARRMHGNERPRPPAGRVDVPGHELLARARLAADQDGHVRDGPAGGLKQKVMQTFAQHQAVVAVFPQKNRAQFVMLPGYLPLPEGFQAQDRAQFRGQQAASPQEILRRNSLRRRTRRIQAAHPQQPGTAVALGQTQHQAVALVPQQRLSFEEVDLSLVDGCSLLCFGSLLLTAEPSRSAVEQLVAYAKERGKITAYDPNWRPPLWKPATKPEAADST